MLADRVVLSLIQTIVIRLDLLLRDCLSANLLSIVNFLKNNLY